LISEDEKIKKVKKRKFYPKLIFREEDKNGFFTNIQTPRIDHKNKKLVNKNEMYLGKRKAISENLIQEKMSEKKLKIGDRKEEILKEEPLSENIQNRINRHPSNDYPCNQNINSLE